MDGDKLMPDADGMGTGMGMGMGMLVCGDGKAGRARFGRVGRKRKDVLLLRAVMIASSFMRFGLGRNEAARLGRVWGV
jgi:hypothetical protein